MTTYFYDACHKPIEPDFFEPFGKNMKDQPFQKQFFTYNLYLCCFTFMINIVQMKGNLPQGKPWTRGRSHGSHSAAKPRGIKPCVPCTHSQMNKFTRGKAASMVSVIGYGFGFGLNILIEV